MYLSIINTNNLFLYVFKYSYDGRRIKIKTEKDSKTIGSHQPTLLYFQQNKNSSLSRSYFLQKP